MISSLARLKEINETNDIKKLKNDKILTINEQINKEFKSFKTTYYIENHTGFDIDILSEKFHNAEKISVYNGQKKKWKIDIDNAPTQNSLITHMITINFRYNDCTSITNLNLEIMEPKKYYYVINRENSDITSIGSGKSTKEKSYIIYLPKTKLQEKTIHLLSPIILENYLETSLYVTN